MGLGKEINKTMFLNRNTWKIGTQPFPQLCAFIGLQENALYVSPAQPAVAWNAIFQNAAVEGERFRSQI